MPPLHLLLLFFGSGACGLIYQVAWMRALTLTLSVSVYAVTTVLCAFMAGLALGAALAGRVADRLERPLLWFGIAELGVGVAGLLSIAFLFELGPVYGWLHGALGGEGIAFTLGRFLLASLVLLVPCTLMGTTLPLLSRAVIERSEVVGRGAGGLYAVNTLGAVAGCVVAGFAVIPQLGLSATVAWAAALNAIVGLSAVTLALRGPRLSPAPRQSEAQPALGMAQPSNRALLAFAAYGVSGFAAIGLEVLWTRVLEQFTHNSTYAYTAMLATFLLGIGAGSALAAPLADRVKRPLAWFGGLELAIGASVVAALLMYRELLHWVPAAASAMGGLSSWPRAVALIFGVAVVTLLLTTLLFGATFPFAARAAVDSVRHVGRRIAAVYTWNTLGAILGAISIGFFILPAIGIRGSFLFLVGVNLAIGVALLAVAAPQRAAMGTIFATATLVLGLVLVPSELFRDLFEARYGKLLMYREQITDIVMVTEDDSGRRFIRYGDGRGTAGTPTFREDRSYAHIALLPHPEPKNILNICFGVGNSLSSVAQYPVERIDQVELSPGVIYAAPFFEETNRGVLADPRVDLTIQDGRNFLLASDDRYDIIRLDPPELHSAGIVNLYTKEFFELARDHLAEGGVFSIWVNIAYTPEREMRMILRTAAEVFPNVSVWHGPWVYSWVINGSVEPRPPDLEVLLAHFDNARVKADLATIPVPDPWTFLSYFVMAGDEVMQFAGDAPVITDDHTVLDFSVPRSGDSYFGLSNSITDHFLVGEMDLESSPLQRAARYCAHKRPVLPHLTNVEASGLSAEQVALLVEERARRLPGHCYETMLEAQP